MASRFALFWVLLSFPLLIACGGPEIRNLRVLDSGYDEAEKATRVRLSFEVWDGDEQITDLRSGSFAVYEDGQPSSNESLTDSQATTTKPPVVLVLDTSYSMYLAAGIDPLKRAAQSFVDQLSQKGFDVRLYAFAATARRIADPGAIPNEFAEGKGGERWTALYHAVNTAFSEEPAAVYVVFSDGADNYSHNYGIGSFEALHGRAVSESKVVHVVTFGNVKNEKDRNGLDAYQALQQLAERGSFHEAAGADAFRSVFADVASRIRKPYLLDYLSPSLAGTHGLELELVDPRGRDRKGPVTFAGTTVPLVRAKSSAASPPVIDDARVTAEASELCEQAVEVLTACNAEQGARLRELVDTNRARPGGLRALSIVCKARLEKPLCSGSTVATTPAAPVSLPSGPRVTLSARGIEANLSRGILIGEVVRGSSAYQAGLRPGDVVQSVNGSRAVSPGEWLAAHRDAGVGAPFKVSVLRGGKSVELSWSLVSCDLPTCTCDNGLCWKAGELAAPRVRIGLALKGGVVHEVLDGPAQRAGVRPGDEIVSVKGFPVREAAGLSEVLAQHGDAGPVEIVVVRDGKDLRLSVVPLVD
jgi:hypothetical protein